MTGVRIVREPLPRACRFLREFTACLVHYRRINLMVWAGSSSLVWAMLALIWYRSGLQTELVVDTMPA